MARIRTIKPAFFRHEGLFEAERETSLPLRVAFAGLWTAADREGRFQWRPRQLKLDALPFDEVDFAVVLDHLTRREFIARYEVSGEPYGFIPSWGNHQVINNRESASSIPPPPVDACRTRAAPVPEALTTREPPDHDATAARLFPAPVEGNGREKEGKGSGTDEGFVSRVPISVDDLMAWLSRDSCEALMAQRATKGLKVLMTGEWLSFVAQAKKANLPIQEAVDHLIETGSHLEGFKAEHISRTPPAIPQALAGVDPYLMRSLRKTQARNFGEAEIVDVNDAF